MLLYGPPKAGKTTILSQLPNNLIIEVEPGGADYVEAMKIEINEGAKAAVGPRAEALMNIAKFQEVLKAIKEARVSGEHEYTFITIDTLSKLDEWAEIAGTLDYMRTVQGKSFNRGDDKKPLSPDDPNFLSVHTLPNGAGYQYSRARMNKWYDDVCSCAEHVIFVAHVKDKQVAKGTETIQENDINLTGKVKTIIASKVDAIGLMYRKGNEGHVSFDGGKSRVCGIRCPHLNGDIVISELADDGIHVNTFWEKVYTNLHELV